MRWCVIETPAMWRVGDNTNAWPRLDVLLTPWDDAGKSELRCSLSELFGRHDVDMIFERVSPARHLGVAESSQAHMESEKGARRSAENLMSYLGHPLQWPLSCHMLLLSKDNVHCL